MMSALEPFGQSQLKRDLAAEIAAVIAFKGDSPDRIGFTFFRSS